MSDIQPADGRFPDPLREGVRRAAPAPPPLPEAAAVPSWAEEPEGARPPWPVSLVGQSVRVPRPFPLGPLLWLALAAAGLALAVVQGSTDLAVGLFVIPAC